jgi:cytochrome c553
MRSVSFLLSFVLTVGLALSAVFGAPVQAPQAAPTPAAIEYFEKSVRPLLVNRCYSCHGAEKQMSGLRLDSRAALLKGGDRGEALMAGDPEHSRLLEAVRQTGALKMPPDGKLADAEIKALADWVRMGAPWPGDAPKPLTTEEQMLERRRSLWSLQPVVRPALPKIKDIAHAQNPIDRFIFAALEKRGLKPAPPAAKTALIRRATLDLTGLPPTPEEVQTFLNDRTPDAYSRLIDRLLASPHYGERWGRQWLDVARYSDTLGYLVGLNGRRYPYAYTYRDYVIRALNADKPYDRFILEQLAADQLELTDKRDLAALGFLTVGNRYLGDTQEIIDDRIDVVCRGLQGLTAGCARCHTHKFDPIPIEDYYSLYSVFNNSHEPDSLPQIADATGKAAYARYQEQLAVLEAKMAEAKKKKDDGQADNIRRDILDFKATNPGAPPCAMVLNDNDKPAAQHVFLRGNAGTPGVEVPRRFLLAVQGDHRRNFEHGSGRLELARAIASLDNPLTARVMVNRLWLGHFGKGLVRTPSDFGARGEPPTNPALLDWLASEFMSGQGSRETAGKGGGAASGAAWSLKKMHRLIMLSYTYRQAAEGDPATVKADPDNRLYGRMNRRRLDFEQMRDALLSVSGDLDATLYGQPVEGIEKSRRRTIYSFIDRQSMPGLLRAFDFPDANQHAPQRSNTTVPQQSLFLLNNPFMQEMAHDLAARKDVMACADVRSRAAKMIALAYARPAREDEIRLAVRFMNRMQRTPLTVDTSQLPAWQYGYGEYDGAAHKLVSYTALPKFTGTAWQGGDALPDKALGWVTLNAQGGHPGDNKHSGIRRWVASRAMTVSITGKVTHPSPNGDGIFAVIYHSRLGTLAAKVVAHGSEDLAVARVEVRRGDTIDFIADCRSNFTSDSYSWSPTLEQTDGPLVPAGAPKQWSGSQDFSGPIETPRPLTAWEIYAQALLMTNAFLYVD